MILVILKTTAGLACCLMFSSISLRKSWTCDNILEIISWHVVQVAFYSLVLGSVLIFVRNNMLTIFKLSCFVFYYFYVAVAALNRRQQFILPHYVTLLTDLCP